MKPHVAAFTTIQQYGKAIREWQKEKEHFGDHGVTLAPTHEWGGRMTVNTTNDKVTVYKDSQGLWRWRRIDSTNGRILSVAAEGYVNQGYAIEAAKAYNQDLDVNVVVDNDD